MEMSEVIKMADRAISGSKIKVLLADDHPLLREGLSKVLSSRRRY